MQTIKPIKILTLCWNFVQ